MVYLAAASVWLNGTWRTEESLWAHSVRHGGGEIAHLGMAMSIEDRSDNSTRFLVVGRELLAPSGDDKTTILVSTSGTAGGAGVLHSLLQPLAEHGVVMTFIESRPSRRKNWDYVFFIDVEGHAEESPVADALSELEKQSSLFRVLGAYPKAVG